MTGILPVSPHTLSMTGRNLGKVIPAFQGIKVHGKPRFMHESDDSDSVDQDFQQIKATMERAKKDGGAIVPKRRSVSKIIDRSEIDRIQFPKPAKSFVPSVMKVSGQRLVADSLSRVTGKPKFQNDTLSVGDTSSLRPVSDYYTSTPLRPGPTRSQVRKKTSTPLISPRSLTMYRSALQKMDQEKQKQREKNQTPDWAKSISLSEYEKNANKLTKVSELRSQLLSHLDKTAA